MTIGIVKRPSLDLRRPACGRLFQPTRPPLLTTRPRKLSNNERRTQRPPRASSLVAGPRRGRDLRSARSVSILPSGRRTAVSGFFCYLMSGLFRPRPRRRWLPGPSAPVAIYPRRSVPGSLSRFIRPDRQACRPTSGRRLQPHRRSIRPPRTRRAWAPLCWLLLSVSPDRAPVRCLHLRGGRASRPGYSAGFPAVPRSGGRTASAVRAPTCSPARCRAALTPPLDNRRCHVAGGHVRRERRFPAGRNAVAVAPPAQVRSAVQRSRCRASRGRPPPLVGFGVSRSTEVPPEPHCGAGLFFAGRRARGAAGAGGFWWCTRAPGGSFSIRPPRVGAVPLVDAVRRAVD